MRVLAVAGALYYKSLVVAAIAPVVILLSLVKLAELVDNTWERFVNSISGKS